MDQDDEKYIRPLHLAENHFLELLLTQFTMRRTGEGTELQVSFNGHTPAITQRLAKQAVSGQISPQKGASPNLYQPSHKKCLIFGGIQYDLHKL